MLWRVTPYELEVRQERGVTVVDLSGELDLTNAADLEGRLDALVGSRLVLDLNRVTFLDSAALHTIFRVARRHDAGQPLGICLEPTAPVARTLAIVKMDEVATVCATLDDIELSSEPAV
jgi:anti-anti-sigma factor